jgi:hypothetical protein
MPKSRNSVAESGNSVDGKRKAERLLKVGISGKSSKSRNFFLNYGNLEKKFFFFLNLCKRLSLMIINKNLKKFFFSLKL